MPEPDTASTAPADATAPAVDNFGFPVAGDVSTDGMSDEELNSFVDKTLGLKGAKPDAQPGSNTDTADTKPTETTKPVEATAPETKVETPAQTAPPEEEKPAVAAEIPTLVTDDLWITVDRADEDGKITNVKLTLDEGVPDDFQFSSDKELYNVLDAFQEMRQIKGQREAEIEQATKEQADQSAAKEGEQQVLAGWNAEIQGLIAAGLMAAPKAEPANGKEYTPAEVAADPALQLTENIFAFMAAENNKRTAAGQPIIPTFALAYNLYTNDAKVKQEAEQEKQANELAKKRGAVVGGSSAPSAGDKGYVYKRGSARNIWAVDTSDI